MAKFTFSLPAALVWLLLAAFSLTIAACGSGATATPTATATQTVPSGLPPTPTPTTSGGPAAGWTADLPAGTQPGELAPDTTVTLADGSTATLAEVAGGKPLLLYFFATW